MQRKWPHSALLRLRSYRSSWKVLELRFPRLPSDSRVSHDVFVGGLLGTGSPKDSFGAKSPYFGLNFVINL